MDIMYTEVDPMDINVSSKAMVYSAFPGTSVVQCIATALYSTAVILIFQCVRALLDHRNDQTKTFKRIILCYLGLVFSLDTAFIALYQERVQLVTQVVRAKNGNPIAQVTVTTTYDFVNNIGGSLCGLLIIWIADALLIYRCYQFHHSRLKPLFGAIVIFFVCIASAGPLLGLFNSVDGSDYEDLELPGNSNWPKEAAGALRLGQYMPLVVNASFSVMLNTLLFLMIIKRLMQTNKELRSTRGENAVANGIPYASILVMLIESSSLVVVACPTYMVFQCFYTKVNLFFLNVQAQVISSCLIIIGVANRRTDYATINVDIGSLRFEDLSDVKPIPTIPIAASWFVATPPVAIPPQALNPTIAIRASRRSSWAHPTTNSPSDGTRSTLTHH